MSFSALETRCARPVTVGRSLEDTFKVLVPEVNRIHAQIAVLGVDAALRHRASPARRVHTGSGAQGMDRISG